MTIYTKILSSHGVSLRVLFLPLYEKSINGTTKEVKYLGGIIKAVKSAEVRKYYFLGILFWERADRLNELIDRINTSVQTLRVITNASAMVAIQHQKVFPQYKNIHKGGVGVIVATGPTLQYYKPKHRYVHFGVNTAYQHREVSLDYWFAIDITSIRKYLPEIKEREFTKFIGQTPLGYPNPYCVRQGRHIPDCFIEECKSAHKFYFNQGAFHTFFTDITTQPLPDLGCCVFSVVYFALFTGVSKIYLVGCDTSMTGHFNGDGHDWTDSTVQRITSGWKIIKKFSEIFYPKTEIISVNPVGLRGVFRDVYTHEYLDANPSVREKLGSRINYFEN